jgi:threonyl-tRNA synthetase
MMLHAACFGSIERFLGMYIETIEGKFPLWINPIHVCIINVNSNVKEYCKKINKIFSGKNIRTICDLSDKTLQQKILIYSTQKVPYLLVIGEKEKRTDSVSVRILGSEKNNLVMKIDKFISKINQKILSKDIDFEL